ncbi:MAG TPA: hypothetical protein P5181_03765 [Dermatophilaceae bacterium]|nr:hypothetical protein [Dermatophilaceae bacterium]
MSFDDLPADWPHRSLRDPQLLCDVVDLVVREDERRAGTVVVILCNPAGRMLQPMAITDVPLDSPADKRRFAEGITDLVAHFPETTLVLVRTRVGKAGVVDDDREWHHALVTVCRERSITLIGVAVATPAGVWALPHVDDTSALAG